MDKFQDLQYARVARLQEVYTELVDYTEYPLNGSISRRELRSQLLELFEFILKEPNSENTLADIFDVCE